MAQFAVRGPLPVYLDPAGHNVPHWQFREWLTATLDRIRSTPGEWVYHPETPEGVRTVAYYLAGDTAPVCVCQGVEHGPEGWTVQVVYGEYFLMRQVPSPRPEGRIHYTESALEAADYMMQLV